MLESILPEYFEIGSGDNSNIGETASVSAASAPPSEDQQNMVLPFPGTPEVGPIDWKILCSHAILGHKKCHKEVKGS